MAQRAVAITVCAGAALAALTLGPIGAVLWRAEGLSALKPGDLQALRFTVYQAFLSALVSCLMAVPVARALARRRFPGRRLLITLLGAPFILPVIVAVMGLLAVFGQQGVLNDALAWVGLPRVDIYGLHGVVLAHVFFNLPLATRILLQGWLALPSEHLRLAASLGLTPWARFRVLEAPLIQQLLPGAFAVIFVICLTSFAVALTLGGGPRATTVELAIYQAVRFDFDLGRAAALALLQLGIGLGAGLVAWRLSFATSLGAGMDRGLVLPVPFGRVADVLWIGLAATFLLLPLGLVVAKGVPGLAELGPQTWRAAGHSIVVALASTALCLAWALALADGRWALLSLATIALSPLVLGTGLFLMLRPYVNPFSMALPVTAVINALMALPFALRIIAPEAKAIRTEFSRLRATLRLTGWAWLRLVLLPRLLRPMGFAGGLVAALAMGDLGVIALFADPERATLPLQVFRLMGAYRLEAAAGAALLLLGLSFGLFWLFDRGGRAGAAS